VKGVVLSAKVPVNFNLFDYIILTFPEYFGGYIFKSAVAIFGWLYLRIKLGYYNIAFGIFLLSLLGVIFAMKEKIQEFQYRKALDFLKNKYKLGVLSNGKPSRRIYEFKNFGLDKYFDVVILSKETPYNKPDKRIFEMAINKVNLPLENILFIDNDIKNIKGADEFGIKNLIYFNEDTNIKSNYTEVNNLKDIINILE
jgi:hypothetical protein